MPSSLVLWTGLGVLLFWAVGAYNRMVRLRKAAVQAFAALDAQLLKQLELLASCLPPSMKSAALTQPGPLIDEVATLWLGLRSAAAQFAASLAAVRARPLDAGAMAALAAARGVLDTSWQRMAHAAPDLAGAPLPQEVQSRWEQLVLQAGAVGEHFNQAVDPYNAAIAQFPAFLLAWVFGFKAARPL